MYICFMAKTFGASVITVYQTLRDLANKDNHGFLSDVEFNRFANYAQLNVFNNLFNELKDSRRLSKAGFEPSRDKARFKRIQEDLAAFSAKATLTKVNGVFNVSTETTAKPLARIISMATAGSILLDQSTKKPIEICYDEEKIERILVSNLSSPTEEFPIALVSEDIYVFPTSVNKIEIRYYKQPQGRSASTGSRVSSPPKYETGSSVVDFELPEHYVTDLIEEMARMMGLNLRDRDIQTYGTNEAQLNNQAETY